MQKILTKKQENKKTRQKQLIIGFVLILLMVVSTLGYALGDREKDENNPDKIEYKGIIFIKNMGFWEFNIENYQFITTYNPKEVENISFFSTLTLQDYISKPLYFTGENNDAIYEISRNLNRFVLRMQKACLLDGKCLEEDLPIKDCSEDNMIIIQEPLDDEIETIYEMDKCVFIIANSSNQMEYADAFLFHILGL